MHAQSLRGVWLFATPWTITCQAPLFMGFSRQEYWSALSIPPQGDLPNPGLWTQVSWISCLGMPSLYRWTTWEAFPFPVLNKWLQLYVLKFFLSFFLHSFLPPSLPSFSFSFLFWFGFTSYFIPSDLPVKNNDNSSITGFTRFQD